eukprot:1384979-Amorphochlora_amoeboformis.AAC.1
MLVVAPTSVLENWLRECQKILPDLRVEKYHGTQNDRLELQETLMDENGEPLFDILLTTYSIFQNSSASADRKWVKDCKFGFMVLDEGHTLKNMQALRYQNLQALRISRKLILSGTPIQNNIKELYSLLSFLDPGTLFKDESLEELAYGDETPGSVEVFRQLLEPFCLRRVKSHVAKEMAPKKEETVKLGLEGNLKSAYQWVIAQHKKTFKKNCRHAFTALRKAANHPLLLRKIYTDEMIPEIARLLIASPGVDIQSVDPMRKVTEELSRMSDFKIHNWCVQEAQHVSKLSRFSLLSDELDVKLTESTKFDYLRSKIPNLIEEGHRVLIFSQWTSLLDILEFLMDELSIQYLRLDGSTPADERQKLVDLFNMDKTYAVFMLSTKAGGVGLNLTGADTVILHDVDFNPQNDLQAENRCHRLGQKQEVTVIRLVTKDSVDEHIYNIAQRKTKLNEMVLVPKEESDKSLTRQVLKDIFS